MSLHILVADDEKPSRDKTARFIKKHRPDAVIIEAPDGIEAVKQLQIRKPDLIFLDIQMPGMDGFDVIRHMKDDTMPPVVFITAYDEYAVQAFEVHAVDYLLKPFDFERFQTAFDRALDSTKQDINRITSLLLEHNDKKSTFLTRIMVKKDERITIIHTDQIQYITSQGKYVQIHTCEHSHMIRRSMQSLHDRLDPATFYRVHRSTIVNIDYIKELQRWFHGDYQVVLKDGTQLKLSRRYSQTLLSHME